MNAVLFVALCVSGVVSMTYVLGDSLSVGMKPTLVSLIGSDLSGFEATVGDGTAAATAKCSFDSQTTHVLVGLGTNDFWRSASTFQSEVSAAVSKMRSMSPGCEIFWTNIYAPRSDVAAGALVLNPVLTTFASSDPLFHVIDWYTEAHTNTYTFPDQLHPSQTVQRANFVYNQMRALATVPFGGASSPGQSPTPGAAPSSLPVIATTPCQFQGAAGLCVSQADCNPAWYFKASRDGASGCEALPNAIRCCADPSLASAPAPTNITQSCSVPSAKIANGVCLQSNDCTSAGLAYASSSQCSGGAVCCALIYCDPPSDANATSSLQQCADADFCIGSGGFAFPSTYGYIPACAALPATNLQCCVFPDDFVSSVNGYETSAFLKAQPPVLPNSAAVVGAHGVLLLSLVAFALQ